MGFWEDLIKFCIKSGGRFAMVRWPDIDKRIINLHNQQMVELAEPEDELWEYGLYVEPHGDPAKKQTAQQKPTTRHGDPKTNGKGHKETK